MSCFNIRLCGLLWTIILTKINGRIAYDK